MPTTSPPEINPRELAWAAGLFEGEGSIHLTRGKKPCISLAMSDEDSVRRFHAAIRGLGYVGNPYLPRQGKKMIWKWQATRFEHVQAIVAMLWYGLGERRRNRCAEVLRGVHYMDRSRCRNGHPRTEPNLIIRKDGRRECRPCNRKTTRDSYRRLNQVPEDAYRIGDHQ